MPINFTPDNEQFLEQALATGVFASREEALNKAVQALRNTCAAGACSDVARAELRDDWMEDLRAWSASRPRVHRFVDDSRESIYESRGG